MFNNANTKIRKRKRNTIPIPLADIICTETRSNARSTLAPMPAHLPIPSTTTKGKSVIYAWRSRGEKKVAHAYWHRAWQYLAFPHPVHTRILCRGFLTAQRQSSHQHLVLFAPSSNFLWPSSSSLLGSKPALTAYSLQKAVFERIVLTSSMPSTEIRRRTGNQVSWMHCRADSTESGSMTRVLKET